MENTVYAMDVSLLEDEGLFSALYSLMDDARQAKIRRLRFGSDRRLSLGAGALLRYGSLRLGICGAEISESENGKPYFKSEPKVHFSISHSGRIAVCAFSDSPVGIDLEEQRPFEQSLIRTVFTRREADALRERGCSAALCTDLWTAKESVMKYLGTGLLLEPDSIEISLEDMSILSVRGYDCSGLHLTSLAADGYSVTVCSGYESFCEGLVFTGRQAMEAMI